MNTNELTNFSPFSMTTATELVKANVLEVRERLPAVRQDLTNGQVMGFQPGNIGMIGGILGALDGANTHQGSTGCTDSTPQRRTCSAGTTSGVSVNGIPIQWPGTYGNFRRILADPSIRFVRSLAYAPIKAMKWVVKERGAGKAPEGAIDFLQRNLDDLRLQFLDDAVRGVDYGWAGFEQVFDVGDDGIYLRKLKALFHDMTSIYSNVHGDFMGFNNNGSFVEPAKAVLFTYDGEAGNLYGRGRCYNLLNVMPWWEDANDGAARYDRKIAGVFLVCHYPPGTSVDATGKLVENSEIAKQMLNAIVAGMPIAVCNEFAGEVDDTYLQGASKADRARWKFELLEDNGSRQPGFIERLIYLDKQKARGFIVPERAAFEAQKSGSRADSESQADIISVEAELNAFRMVRVLNGASNDPSSVINNLLRLNYGKSAIGSCYLEPMPMHDDTKKFLREVAKIVLTGAPHALGMASSILDTFEGAGLPIPSNPADESVIVDDIKNTVTQPVAMQGDRPSQAKKDMKLSRAVLQEKINELNAQLHAA